MGPNSSPWKRRQEHTCSPSSPKFQCHCFLLQEAFQTTLGQTSPLGTPSPLDCHHSPFWEVTAQGQVCLPAQDCVTLEGRAEGLQSVTTRSLGLPGQSMCWILSAILGALALPLGGSGLTQCFGNTPLPSTLGPSTCWSHGHGSRCWRQGPSSPQRAQGPRWGSGPPLVPLAMSQTGALPLASPAPRR